MNKKISSAIVSAVFVFFSLTLLGSPSRADQSPPAGFSANPAAIQNPAAPPLGTLENPTVKKDEKDITNNDLLQAVRAGSGPLADVKMQIVQKITDVRLKKITPEDFYKQVSAMEMPAGKEVRHVLMEVKKDIGNYLGENGLRRVFGDLYSSGGSQAESIILSHRKDVVMETIKQVIKDFAGADLPFTVYYSEVGGWPDEGPKDMKFAGDIDFNFLCGDLETAMRLKKAYDAYIVKRYGRTPEELDIPCTVHGMATGEVYVGKKGQGFAEGVTKTAKKINFNEDGKGARIEEGVAFKRALGNMLAEAEFSKVPLANLEALKWPTEPGVSLEMIRHFEHDIVGQNVYTDLESFVKAAKYTDRSFGALEKDGGADAVKDKLLRNLTEELVAAKKSPKKQVELLEAYYKAKGKPLPFDAELDINANGKTEATLKYNEKLITEFWDDCRKTMWESANTKLKKVVNDFKRHARSLEGKDPEEVKILYDELNKYNEMMEIENRVLTDPKAGLHDKMNGEYQRLVGEFRDVVKDFKQQAAKHDYLKVIDPAKSDSYKMIHEQLKLDNPSSVRLAAAALAQAPGKLNDMLDFFDDNLLNNLRYGETKNFNEFLRSGKKAFWDDQADYFMGKVDASRYPEHTRQSQMKVTALSKEMDAELTASLAARGLKLVRGAGGAALGAVQDVNNSFNRSVAASGTGQAMMQGMMIYNLSQEIPVYVELMAKEDWRGLAAEFFKRRIPLGSAVERGVMGDYWGVAWETTATILPPTAIFSAAESIGESMGQTTWDVFWSEELKKFVDQLYDQAVFKIVGVETTGDNIKISQWELVSVSYHGEVFNIRDLIQLEAADATEMAACVQRLDADQAECFPIEKFRNGLFKWMDADNAFRTNLRKSDPWIQMIEEMEDNRLAGPEVKSHFQYKKYTRWEQLKVNFLIKLKETLENRRAGEQALLSGDFPRMYDELFMIAEKLDIRPQVAQAMNDKFGGDVAQAMTAFKDLLRGVVRDVQGDVDVWDVHEELSAYVTDALRTYKRIWDGRQAAEDYLTLQRQDQGLRLLTGPYFLTGVHEEDQEQAAKWFDYPSEVVMKMVEEMTAIKAAAGADPAGLDTSEGAYDKGVLERLVFHDTFRELWKHVNGRFIGLDLPSYLGREESQQAVPNEPGGPTDQDRAIERFEYHQQQVDDLLNEFRAHYGLKQEDELTELRDLRDQALGLAAEICADCDTAMAGMEAMTAGIEGVQAQFGEFESSIKDAVQAAKELESIEKELAANHATAEGLAVRIGDGQVLAGERRDAVCQAAQAMAECQTNGERDALYGEATSAHAQVKPAFEKARADYAELEGLANSTKEKWARLSQAQQAAADIDGIPEEILAAKDDVASRLQSAEALLQSGPDAKLQSIKGITHTAHEAYAKAKEALKPIRKTPKGAALWDEMKQIMDEISAQYKVAAGCLKGPQSTFKSEKAKADHFLNRCAALEADLNRIHQAFRADGAGETNPLLASAMEKTNLIDLLVSMGQGYVEACAEHLVMAKACMNKADQLSTIDFSAWMPNIVGMTCQEGSGAVAGNKIDYQIVSKGRAVHPDWEFRVESTDPPGGVEVTLRETTAVISCYEDLDIPAYLATIDCRPVPGSTAVYDRGQRRGVCDCINGVIFNPSRTRCINCNEYLQGYLGAFNAGDLDNAQGWVNEARACPWAPEAQGEINAERQRRACDQIAAGLQAACQSNNAQWASGLLGEANNWRCNIHPGLIQCANNLINAYNDYIRQQQAQQQQQQQQQMQDFMNAMTDMVNQMNNQRNPPPVTTGGTNQGYQNVPMPDVGGNVWGNPPPPPSGGTTGGSSGGSSGGSDPCAGCRGMCLLGVCQD